MRDGYEDAEPAVSWVNPAPLGKYAMREDCGFLFAWEENEMT